MDGLASGGSSPSTDAERVRPGWDLISEDDLSKLGIAYAKMLLASRTLRILAARQLVSAAIVAVEPSELIQAGNRDEAKTK